MKPAGKDIAITEKDARKIQRRPSRVAILALAASVAVLALVILVVVADYR